MISLIVLVYLFVVSLSTIADQDDQVNQPMPLIIGGSNTNYDTYPFMAAIMFDGGSWELGALPSNFGFSCGGSIIRKEYPAMILTAAHCLKFDRRHDTESQILDFIEVTQYMRVRLGLDTFYDNIDNINKYEFRIKDFQVHENYNTDNSIQGDNDIAILYLDADLSGIDKFKAIDIASTEPNNNEAIRLIGYGNDATFNCPGGKSNCDKNPSLEYADLTYHSWNDCYYYSNYDPTFTNNQFCVSDPESNACHGDSGGPLIIQYNDGSSKQFGIVHGPHNGQDCAGYDRNTNAIQYISWIQQQKARNIQ